VTAAVPAGDPGAHKWPCPLFYVNEDRTATCTCASTAPGIPYMLENTEAEFRRVRDLTAPAGDDEQRARLRDLHAQWHDQAGNLLGKDECGWERCEFWEVGRFVQTGGRSWE